MSSMNRIRNWGSSYEPREDGGHTVRFPKKWFTLTCNHCKSKAGVLKRGNKIFTKCPVCGCREQLYGLTGGNPRHEAKATKRIEKWKKGEVLD